MAKKKKKYGLFDDAIDSAQYVSNTLTGVGEVGLQLGGGLLGMLVQAPGAVYDTLLGRGSEEQREKYPGLGEREQTDLVKDAVAFLTYTPKTEAGQEYSETVGEVGGAIDKGMRYLSGAVPEALDFVPGEHPYASNLWDQTLYGAMSVLPPTRIARGMTSAAKAGMGTVAGDMYLGRLQRAGKSGLDIPWYGGGKYAQIGMMPLEVAGSKLKNFLSPKSAYLSETYGLNPLTVKELKRLEGVMDSEKLSSAKHLESFNRSLEPRIEYYQSMAMNPELATRLATKDKSASFYMDKGMTRQSARKLANKELKAEGTETGNIWSSKKQSDSVIETAWNEYFNEISKIMATERTYNPGSARLKRLEEGLVQHILPTSRNATFKEVMDNPGIIRDVVGGGILDEALMHVIPFIGKHLDVKGKNVNWVTKPLEGGSGAGVKSAAIASRIDKKTGRQKNAYTSIHSIWNELNKSRTPITKESILAKAEELNARKMESGETGFHNIESLRNNILEQDGFISFGTASLTPDRLLATMNHRFVLDPQTGTGMLLNYDHYKLGGNKVLDKIADIGAKKRFVVLDTVNFSMKKGAPKSSIIEPQPVGRLLPDLDEGVSRRGVVREEMSKKFSATPPTSFRVGRGLETAYTPVMQGLLSQKKKRGLLEN